MKSPFVRYCLSVLGCLIVFCIFFIVMVFGTNTVYREYGDNYNSFANTFTVSMNSVMKELENDANAPANDPSAGAGGTWQPTGSWYSEVPDELKKAGSVVETITLNLTGESYSLYNGLPWDAEDSTYIFDTVQAAEDVISFIDTYNGSPTGLTVRHGVARMSGTIGKFDDRAVDTLNGVNCLRFAPPPCVYDRDYCDNFTKDTWYTKCEGANAGDIEKSNTPRRYCAILQSKADESKTYYLPLCVSDVKAHTFPGGVLQTHIGISDPSPKDGPYNVYIAKGNGDDWNKHVITMSDAIAMITGAPGAQADLSSQFYICLEICLASKEDSAVLKNYRIIGYVAWDD